MQRTRWIAVGVVVPTIAALGIACDQRTPTEVEQRPSARTAEASAYHDGNDGIDAEPFVFVGSASQCGGVPGSRIVTSAWLGGMGLPDSGEPDLNTPQNRSDRDGLMLNKNGPTADCSSSGARLTGVRGMLVDATFTLGFDYRDGGHCSGGSPRFNVTTRAPDGSETFHFVGGCGNDPVPTPAPQDAANWTRVRFPNPVAWAPAAVPGSRIVSISILYDEGTDAPSAHGKSQEPSGIGLAVIDNIFVNGRFVREGSGDAEP
jgi:hypothetical protein